MKDIGILGVPMDLGQGRRGVDMGPSAMRYGRLQEVLQGLGHRVHDYGDIKVPVVESLRASKRWEDWATSRPSGQSASTPSKP